MLKHWLRKIGWSKLKSPVPSPAKGDSSSSLSSDLNVNVEYNRILETRSYAEIVNKVQAQLKVTTTDELCCSSSSSSIPFYVRLSESLLEPGQELAMNIINALNIHHLLIDYFDASLEASNMYELILHGIYKARSNHRFITRAVRVGGYGSDHDHDPEFTDDQCQTIIQNLRLFASLSNPMATISLNQFSDFHSRFLTLQHELDVKQTKIKKRLKLFTISKRFAGYAIYAGGCRRDPGAVAKYRASRDENKRSRSMVGRRLRGSRLDRLYVQLDLAKKGVYVLLNDFGTSRMLLTSIDNEVEHRKVLADLCAMSGKNHIVLREVLRELSKHEEFLEQLDELEAHVYVCFNAMNRARKILIGEIMATE
ncbi:hypothetical protein Droror1_Dr00010647 [Drosera rotundifolia]